MTSSRRATGVDSSRSIARVTASVLIYPVSWATVVSATCESRASRLSS